MEGPKQEPMSAKESKDILVPSKIQLSVPPTKGVINQAIRAGACPVLRARNQGQEHQRDAVNSQLLPIRTCQQLALTAFDLRREFARSMRGQLWNPRSVLNDAS
jgi:hypothetical protein